MLEKVNYMTNVCGINLYRRCISQLYESLRLGGADPQYSAQYLMNRERVGIPLRHTLQEALFGLVEPATLVIDFTGVKEMTGSVTEEIGPRLFGAFQNHRNVNPETYLIYDNLSQEIRKELDAWFAKYGQCIPAFPQKDDRTVRPLIGALPPDNILEILEYCYAHGIVSSADLEQRFSAASKKLTDVQNQYPWLLRRYGKVRGDTPRSWRYQFIPITPLDRQRKDQSIGSARRDTGEA